MYNSPNVVVIVAAVDAEITPPAKVPTPGKNLNIFDTIVLPTKVAPVAPVAAAVSVLRNAVESSSPKVADMLANIEI